MDARPTWTDCDKAGDYVVSNVLSPRDLVSGPDKTDETVPQAPRSLVPRLGLGTTWLRELLSGS